MNRDRWIDSDYDNEVYIAKLAEELGEVAKEHGELLTCPSPLQTSAQRARRRMIEELDHVTLIASVWSDKIQRDIEHIEKGLPLGA